MRPLARRGHKILALPANFTKCFQDCRFSASSLQLQQEHIRHGESNASLTNQLADSAGGQLTELGRSYQREKLLLGQRPWYRLLPSPRERSNAEKGTHDPNNEPHAYMSYQCVHVCILRRKCLRLNAGLQFSELRPRILSLTMQSLDSPLDGNPLIQESKVCHSYSAAT